MHKRTALAALTLTALVGLVAAPATAKAPVVETDPPKLAVSTTSTAHLEGTTIVDGSLRIPVAGAHVRWLGEIGTGYVVESTRNDVVSTATILRYAADGTATTLGTSDFYSSVLSQDGAFVVALHTKQRGPVRTRLTALDTTTGAVLGTHRLRDYATLLDADAGRVVIGSFASGRGAGGGTSIWTLAGDTVTRITRHAGTAADLRNDLLASFSKDPYEGGVTVVSHLSSPGKRLWSSPSERVETFSTDGSRMALAGIFDDGIGPAFISVRSVTGKRLVAYSAAGGYYGELRFESPSALLLDAHGPRKTALVRCTDATCERVGSLSRTTY